ncbi:hypothetical protein Tco_1047602, partial [Tanacetum coccineum]
HYILLGLSSKTRALWKISCLLEAARQLLTCIRLCLRGQSCLHALSTGCGPNVCAIRTSYVSRQCTSFLPLEETSCSLSPEETAAPYLLRRLMLLTS